MTIFSLRLLRTCLILTLLALGLGRAGAATDGVEEVEIVAQASMSYVDRDGGPRREIASNKVEAMAPLVESTIAFYSDEQFSQRTWTARAGRPLLPLVRVSGCNRDPLLIDTIVVAIEAQKSGQRNEFTAIETAPNSGLFKLQRRVLSRFWAAQNAPQSDAQDVMPGDVLTATASNCKGGTVTTQLRLDPRAVVFDESSGQPLIGATVMLIDVTGEGNGGFPGAPALVFDGDGQTQLPSTVITDAEGSYSFPVLRFSTYRLVVRPAPGYVYPATPDSVASVSTFTTGRADGGLDEPVTTMAVHVSTTPAVTEVAGYEVHGSASYGGTFRIDATNSALIVNLPVEPPPQALMVRKTASRNIVEIAETLEYAVSVKNAGEVALDNVRLQDTLPLGFAYVAGSARLNGRPVADPAGGRGPRLEWAIDTKLAAATEHTLRYRVRIGSNALHGDGVNRAQATAAGPRAMSSNVASAKVKIEPGVFSDRGIVIGTVFADCDSDGLQGADERGVAGVRLWLEDGTSVTTDSAGRFSLYGLRPRTHVLKLDPATLPAGTVPRAISQRHAGDGRSRFVDLRAGELQRADFALGACSADLDVQLRERARAAAPQELDGSLRTALQSGTAASGQDRRALPAAGTVGMTAGASAAATPTAANAPAAAASAATTTPAEPTALPGFLELQDGQVLAGNVATVRVAGRLGARLALQVNGKPVAESQIGERTQDTARQIELLSYIGLPLQAGDNRLTLTEHDSFGVLRATRELNVRVAGALARIVIDAPAQAEGGALGTVTVRLEDAQGLPVPARLPVTLSIGAGQWQVDDLDPRTPELQTFIEGGSARLQWRASDMPGEAQLRASANGVTGTARVAVVPALRPLMAVGLVEAAFNLKKLKPGSVQPVGSGDAFEQQLRAFADGPDGTPDKARGAVFLKGKVRGDMLLTLAYDSAKGQDERLFRDIQPDAFYPVYGDDSVKGFDAQSTGRLYVRVDRGQSSLLYGDFTTQGDDATVRQLGSYQRSLNGVKQHLQIGALSANLFAARDSTRQVVVELRGNGTSGPYVLGGLPVANSERVEVLVRDRNQPALVLSSTEQARFSDYEIDPLSGRLLFRAPVPSVDADLNPVSIRVTYEVDQGGPNFWVAGADAQWQVTESLKVGGAIARDWNPLAPMQMASANATLNLAPKTVLSAEIARTERGAAADGTAAHEGNAERLALTHDGDALKVRAHVARSDVGFDNRTASISSGRNEAAVQATYMVAERTRLAGELMASGDIASGAERAGVLLGVEHSLADGTKIEIGVRHVEQHGATPADPVAANDSTTTSVRGKVTTAVPGLPTATVFVEAEQDVRDADKRLLAVGGDYQIAGRGRVYLRHELISSLTGPYSLDPMQRHNTTVLGLDAGTTVAGGEGRVFSEYRGREAFGGRETEAAIGLRNQWQLRPGLRVNASLERVQALTGSQRNNENAALTGAVEYTADPTWKGSARLELREGGGATSVLSTVGVAIKLDREWTLLGKNLLARTFGHGERAGRLQERFQLGAAYRGADHRSNALARYEYKDENGGVGDVQARRVHVFSTHAERQLSQGFTVSGRYAAKQVSETLDGVRSRAVAQLASVRVMKDLGERWDVGVSASVMGDARLRGRQTALGAEAGYRVQENLWVSVGYNVSGFKDRELSADNATARGAYVRLRFKFDENLFSR